MTAELSELTASDLAEIAAFTTREFGLSFPAPRLSDLVRGVVRTAADLSYRNPADFLRHLREAPPTPHTLDVLIGHLTVGETYFFRERACFDGLRERVLPDLIEARSAAGRRRLRIWSAGCCTGEEPYSIAMLLDSMIPDSAQWDVKVLATDVNRRFLKTAEQGVYHDWSFRNLPDGMREQYFRKRPDGWHEVLARVRGMVTFAHLNLARDEYPSPFTHTQSLDLVLCRNVLMYFDPTVAQMVVQRLERTLASDGWLAVSSTELMLDLFRTLTQAPVPGSVFFQKPSVGQPATPVPFATGAAPAAQAPVSSIPEESPPIRMPAVDIAETDEDSGHKFRHRIAPPLRARQLADAGNLSAALEWADRALAENRLDPAGHYLRANILLAQGDRAEASAALDRAIFLDSGFALAHFTLGVIARLDGKAARAERYLDNALSIVAGLHPQQALADADGMTAGRLGEIIRSIRGRANNEPVAKPGSTSQPDDGQWT